jgi:hypothetical protein
MKTFILSTALVSALIGLKGNHTVQVGDIAPEIGGEWSQSEVNSLAACRGRVTLIEFWRTW